ncbi:hypothetical protein [Thermoplasma sp. Kam2015]|uniref:hypothetical protein n=1 Tax=Thermoplasma sp. Kam2015 TaxID=2094122 RepID=UPI001293B3E3|nr:hypothetical protein [Thermoplasma sp. Kam2015]
MNKKIAAIIATMIVILIVSLLAFYFSQSPVPKASVRKVYHEFHEGALHLDNITVNILGGGYSSLKRGTSNHTIFSGFYFSNENGNITGDSLTLSDSNTSAIEIINITNLQLIIKYDLYKDRFTETYAVKNMGNFQQPLNFVLNLFSFNLTNVTIFEGYPNSSTNITLSPQTFFGISETYDMYDTAIYGVQWGNGTNVSVNWYSLEGMLSSSELTFAGEPSYISTQMYVYFSGVKIPEGTTLDIGNIFMSF